MGISAFAWTVSIVGLIAVVPGAAHAAPMRASAESPAAGHSGLLSLFHEWRAFNQPRIVQGRPDYSPAAMAEMAAGLERFRKRLDSFDASGWSIEQQNDLRLVRAEMNGLDFFLRVLKPWARDPSFYATVFTDMSDVPAHEGPFAEPNIDLWAYRFPLSKPDEAKLIEQLSAVPGMLEDARTNLAPSTAHDFWQYADRSFTGQVATLDSLLKGEVALRDLSGTRTVKLEKMSPALVKAITQARDASRDFATWVKAEAPRHKGPVGVGKANYEWWIRNVLLSPYSFDDQIAILQRELDRSVASLKLEEARNAGLPKLTTPDDPDAYMRLSVDRSNELYDLWVARGVLPERKDFRDALVAQSVGYVAPADRNFFTHVTAEDPTPLAAHFFHWPELAERANTPHANPIRAATPLFNMYADRSEGVATAMEEVSMHLGVYDRRPRARELTWIMLAARAARGLAAMKVQAQEMELDEAARFHAQWTPRGWADAESELIGYEQLLYARQPGYGPSYVIGKAQLDALIAKASHEAEMQGKPFDLGKTFQAIWASGVIPFSLTEREYLQRLDLAAK